MNQHQPPQLPADRLKAMLSGAKQIMNKVETGDYSSGNIDPNMMVNSSQLVEAHAVPQQYHQAPTQGRQNNFATSKMPQAIKEAMMNTPDLPVWNPHHTFDLADVAELIEKPIPQQQQYRQTPQQPIQNQKLMEQQYQQQFQQQAPNDMMMVSEAQLTNMMHKYMMDFMTTTFTKSLSEEVIKTTIGTLIKEGKITVKSKPNIVK